MTYRCKICGKEFPNKNAIGGHMVTAHRPDLQRMKSLKLWSDPVKRGKMIEWLRRMVRRREERRKRPKLTQVQKEVIVGCVLGDGNLQLSGRQKNARLRIAHSSRQLEYAMWKYSILKNVVRTPPKIVENRGFGIGKKLVRFSTITHPWLTEIYRLCYINGKKRITEGILNLMTERSLAVLYMDDGTLQKGPIVYLHLEGFPKEDLELMRDWLMKSWKLRSKIRKHRKHHFLAMDVASTKRFIEIVKPYIIPPMRYKITYTT